MLEIYRMPGHLIRRLHQISVSAFAERTSQAGFDITPVQFAALNAIDEHPAIDQATLAATIACDRPTIGGVVERLAQKGYVRRIVSRRDRRARELSMTEEGRAALRTLLPIVRKAQADMLSGLNDEEKQVFSGLIQKAVNAANDISRAPLRRKTA